MLIPADEIDDVTPRPEYEDFYHLAMLHPDIGDPEAAGNGSLATGAAKISGPFYKLLRQWLKSSEGLVDASPITRTSNSSAVLLQYLIWYDTQKGNANLDGRYTLPACDRDD